MDEKGKSVAKTERESKDCSAEDNLKSLVNEELTKIGSGGPWVW